MMCCNVAHCAQAESDRRDNSHALQCGSHCESSCVSQVVSHLNGYKGWPSIAEADAAALLMELTGRTLDNCPSYSPSCNVRKGFAMSFVGLDAQWSNLC